LGLVFQICDFIDKNFLVFVPRLCDVASFDDDEVVVEMVDDLAIGADEFVVVATVVQNVFFAAFLTLFELKFNLVCVRRRR
jgi:hypothetical protein